MRTKLASILSVVSCLSCVALAGCASEEEGANEGGRFDDVVGAPPREAPAPGDEPTVGAAEPPAVQAPGEQPNPGADPPAPTAEARTCRTARDLGAISGDTGTASVSAQGTCSDWVRVRVTENWSGPTAGGMKLTATLISPDKEDFDVFVYLTTESDVLECTTATAKSELPSGRSDIVKVQWGEQYTFNNSNDARTVSIQVKKKSGTCAKAPWALLLQGNY